MVHGTHNAVDDKRNEHIKIYVNGEFFNRFEAKISVFDSGYLVGDGIWEALRLHQGVLVFIDEHLDRLFDAAKTIGLDLNMSRDQLTDEIWKTLKVNNMNDGVYVRIMITRGIKNTPSQDPRLTISGPNVVIIPEYKLASKRTQEKGISLFTGTIRRGHPDYLDPKLNCHSKLHEVQALIQAIEAGADEALMLNPQGAVSTCNSTNFFMVKNGEVFTSTGQYCMNGITRKKVIQLCNDLSIKCYQKDFSLFDVYGADEAFVTGTFGGLTPVMKVDGRQIGSEMDRTITSRLNAAYHELIETTVRSQ